MTEDEALYASYFPEVLAAFDKAIPLAQEAEAEHAPEEDRTQLQALAERAELATSKLSIPKAIGQVSTLPQPVKQQKVHLG